MSRLTADLEAIRNFIGFGFAQILNMVLMILFGGAMMLSIHWQLTLITLVTIPLLGFAAIRFERNIHPAFREMRQAMSNLTTAVQENITGVRTVKSLHVNRMRYLNFPYAVKPIKRIRLAQQRFGRNFSL